MAGLSHCTSAPWLVCHIVHLPHDWLLPSGDLAINQSVSLPFVTHIILMDILSSIPLFIGFPLGLATQ